MKKNKPNEIVENIVSQPMDELMSDRYSIFAKYVIQDRAIPDARDGLKPVQRRIIYTMFDTGNDYSKKTRKCAKIVGDVMGRFHPHGDTSIYDALTRLSQSWKMNQPLIYFQGNNGSIDNDPAAAYRYTEAKLEEISEYMTMNLEKNIVDKTLNYDDNEFEPIVLPARFPNLFVNGSEGIAVAIATAIPPHNLGEMCLAAIYRIKHPNSTLEELMQIVHGPDLPTGGVISGINGIKEMYSTGRGKFEITSKYEIKEYNDYNEIIITEIPYSVVKKDLVYSIDNIRKSKEIDGIIEVKDLSSGDDIKIVIDTKKEINPNIVVQFLLNKTKMRINYSANIVAINNKHPETLSLIKYLDIYTSFLKEINYKQYKFDYDKTKNRLHILDGLLKANDIIDEIVKIIRKSINKEDAKQNLIKSFDFSDIQAEAILNIRLYKLSHTDINIYIDEKKELEKFLSFCDLVINDENELNKVVINDLKEIVKKVPSVRKSIIQDKNNDLDITKRDLISDETTFVAITKDGYIKRSSIKSYKASESKLPGIKEGDNLVFAGECSTLDYILCFTNLGNFLFVPVHEIIENKWKDEGKHINYLINLPLNEYIIKSIIVENFEKDVSIGLISKNGQIKKTLLKEFFVQRYSKPICCMKLMKNDELKDAFVLTNNNNILVLTSNGNCTYFNENEISLTGIKSSGVKSISKLGEDNFVVGCIQYHENENSKILLITDNANYRIFDSKNLTLTARLGAQQKLFKSFKSEPHSLVYFTKILNKENLELFALLNDNQINSFTISDFSLSPIDRRCKRNIDDIPLKNTIFSIFNFNCEVIDDDLIPEKRKVKNDGDNGEIEQLSLF